MEDPCQIIRPKEFQGKANSEPIASQTLINKSKGLYDKFRQPIRTTQQDDKDHHGTRPPLGR